MAKNNATATLAQYALTKAQNTTCFMTLANSDFGGIRADELEGLAIDCVLADLKKQDGLLTEFDKSLSEP
jgi:hypothetical protein